MGRGRKPKPTTLRVLQGNPGKRRLNKDEPNFGAGAPDKPTWLDEYASEAWDYFVFHLLAARVLQKAYQHILIVACSAYSQLRKCEKFLAEKQSISYVMSTDQGDVYRPFPEVAQLNQARRQLHSACAELGVTPPSSTKVKQLPQTQPGGAREFLG